MLEKGAAPTSLLPPTHTMVPVAVAVSPNSQEATKKTVSTMKQDNLSKEVLIVVRQIQVAEKQRVNILREPLSQT